MLRKTHRILLHKVKRVFKKIHQSLLHQGKSAKENTSKPPPTKGSFEDKTKRTCQANIDSYNTYLNAKKVHVMKQGAVGRTCGNA